MLDMYLAVFFLAVGLFGLLHQVTSGRMHPLASFRQMTPLQLIFTSFICAFALYILVAVPMYFPLF